MGDQPLHTPRMLRVVCIGAGYAGLMLAYKWKYQPGMTDTVDLAIYEKNPHVGGTWFENRYPGVACDVCARTTMQLERKLTILIGPSTYLHILI